MFIFIPLIEVVVTGFVAGATAALAEKSITE